MVTVTVKAHPGAKKEKVVRVSGDCYEVWVQAVSQDGRANKDVLKILAEFLSLKKNQLVILKGETSRIKIIGII